MKKGLIFNLCIMLYLIFFSFNLIAQEEEGKKENIDTFIEVNLNAEPKEKYVKKELCVIKMKEDEKNPTTGLAIDPNENIYYLYENGLVEVYNKKGEKVNEVKFNKPISQSFSIEINPKGDILYYSRNGYEIMLIYDKEKNQIKTIRRQKYKSFQKIKFLENGIYSEDDGEIIYNPENKLNLNDKIFIKDFNEEINWEKNYVTFKYKDINLKLPRKINDFSYQRILKIDNKKKIYIYYETPGKMLGDNKYEGWMEQYFKMYKINLKGELLTSFDFVPVKIDEKTESIYDVKGELKKDIEFDHIIKWEKQE